jgi:exodeoxyribonuclease V alpha subunit
MGLRRNEFAANDGLLILDEASMLDLPIVYSILRAIGPAKRLLFVGDPAQLPPIGPGLVFHRMVGSPLIPQVELKTIHRQASETGIPTAGAMIRAGQCPPLKRFDFTAPHGLGVFWVSASEDEIQSATLRAVTALADPAIGAGIKAQEIQVLCATRKGSAGSEALNEAIEQRHCRQAPPSHWGLQPGSKIVWLVNDHHRGNRDRPQSLLNGALGIITSVETTSLTAEFDDESTHRLHRGDLAKLERGWAISIHKAQGSAFRHVVVPIVRSALLDRALVYTAITRATHSVVLVGNRALWADAIKRLPSAENRRVGLRFWGGAQRRGLSSASLPFPHS